jgi:outer membrane murein-binding lipoprotein Lpp
MTKKFKAMIIGTVGILVLSGCSSEYRVDFDSNPSGASLVCNGKNWGYTPKSLYYDESVKQYKTLNVSSCSANWVSGATESYPQNLRIFSGGATVITAQRPNVDGYEKDVQFSLQVQNSNYQRRQAQAAEDSAYQQKRKVNSYIRYRY